MKLRSLYLRPPIEPDPGRPMAEQPPAAEFVKVWSPGGESTVTLRIQAEARWRPGMPQDLNVEERSEFNAAVLAGMHRVAVALGVTPAAEPVSADLTGRRRLVRGRPTRPSTPPGHGNRARRSSTMHTLKPKTRANLSALLRAAMPFDKLQRPGALRKGAGAAEDEPHEAARLIKALHRTGGAPLRKAMP